MYIYCNIRIYADDSILYLDYQDAHQAKDKLQEDIANIGNWAEKWLVSFNPLKTESPIFSRKRNSEKPSLVMGTTPVKEVHKHKHLGIIYNTMGNGPHT